VTVAGVGNQKPASVAAVHTALFTVAVLFSLNYLFGKIALRGFHPLALAWLRVCGSAALLTGFAFLQQRRWPLSVVSEKRALILYSLLGVVFNQLLFISGLSLTTAHEAAILITTIPVFTLVVAIWVKAEQASLRRLLGIAIAASGALAIVGFQGIAGTRSSVIGDILVLMNCSSFGTYLVVSRPMMARYAASIVIAGIFLLAVPLMLPFCIVALLHQNWQAVSSASWMALGGMILGPTVIAYQLNGWALARAESSTVAVYTYLQPFIASLLAAAVLRERIERSTLLSGTIICAGVAIATWRAGKKREKEEVVVNDPPAPGVG